MTKKATPTQKKEVKIETLAALLNAIPYCYPSKKGNSQPGLVLSLLKDGNFYGSIVTYDGAFGEGKNVLFTHQAATTGELLRGLAGKLVARQDVLDQLRKAL